ncbi:MULTISPECIES: hypothetical protein [unclassified Streptomyces]|uniref:hypothetical protein n=1 Tax=unclassified Streptomyces TaxID=2593676 RepID=UPI003316C338
MLSPDLRLRLIDGATDRLGEPLSQASFCLYLRHLRRADLDPAAWHRCSDLATSGACSHHQARAVAAQLVASGLLERRTFGRRTRGADHRYTAYRLVLPAPRQEGEAL